MAGTGWVVGAVATVATLNVLVGAAAIAADPSPPVALAAPAPAPVDAVFILEASPAVRANLFPADVRDVTSTGYCLSGITASGQPVGHGVVAMNGVPLGSTWRLVDGPLAGATVTALDRIGHGSDFDLWFPTCDQARAYGRRPITVVRTS